MSTSSNHSGGLPLPPSPSQPTAASLLRKSLLLSQAAKTATTTATTAVTLAGSSSGIDELAGEVRRSSLRSSSSSPSLRALASTTASPASLSPAASISSLTAVHHDIISTPRQGHLGGAEASGSTTRSSTPLGKLPDPTLPTLLEDTALAIVQDTAESMHSSSSSDLDAEDARGREERDGLEEPFDQVGRDEARVDPRELLRAQLRKSQSQTRSKGKGKQVVPSDDTARALYSAQDSTMLSNVVECYSPRRYFVLSTAGKLVYTTDEDEEAATAYVGVIQAIISIYADEGDRIKYVIAGRTRVAFYLKSPLYLVCVSDWGEPESVLRTHLEYLYLQVLSVVTLAQLQGIFSKRSNFDLRRLLEGTEPFFNSLTTNLQTSLPILTNSLNVYRLNGDLRTELSKALIPPKAKADSLYALLLRPPTSSDPMPTLITLLRPKAHSIHPTDLHLLLSTLTSSTAPIPVSASLSQDGDSGQNVSDPTREPTKLQAARGLLKPGEESWIPICLPKYNEKGFLFAWIGMSDCPIAPLPAPPQSLAQGVASILASPLSAPLDDGGSISGDTTAGAGGGAGISSLGIILLGGDREGFSEMREWGEKIKAKLKERRLDWRIMRSAQPSSTSAAKSGGYSLGELAIPGLRHFVYKSRALVQVTFPVYEGEYLLEHNRYRLVTLYQNVYDQIHHSSTKTDRTSSAASIPKLIYLRTQSEGILAWMTPSFELYIATAPLLPKTAVVAVAKAVARWVKSEESSLFLMSAPTF